LHQAHRSIVSPPGGMHDPRPAVWKADNHHHHPTPCAGPYHCRGRHPQGRPHRRAEDALGRRRASTASPHHHGGYQNPLTWAEGLGEVDAVGMEGTSSDGAGLTRFRALCGRSHPA
jgi:hypothetical protein